MTVSCGRDLPAMVRLVPEYSEEESNADVTPHMVRAGSSASQAGKAGAHAPADCADTMAGVFAWLQVTACLSSSAPSSFITRTSCWDPSEAHLAACGT